GLQGRVVEQEGQGYEAVEPVRDAFPALGLAAEPGAVLDVGPEFVEVPAQAGGLDAELVLEPASGLDTPEGQGLEGHRTQARPRGLGRERLASPHIHQRRAGNENTHQRNRPVTTRHDESLPVHGLILSPSFANRILLSPIPSWEPLRTATEWERGSRLLPILW